MQIIRYFTLGSSKIVGALDLREDKIGIEDRRDREPGGDQVPGSLNQGRGQLSKKGRQYSKRRDNVDDIVTMENGNGILSGE